MNTIVKLIIMPLLVGGLILQAVELDAKRQALESLEQDLTMAEYKVEVAERTLAVTQVLQARVQENNAVQTVTVTAYNPTTAQCDADPFVAASMREVRAGTIAVSRDLFDQGWVFGKKVRIEGMGIFEINDLMNRRFSQSVDVFMWNHKDALRFGRKDLRVALLEI